jgi:hypothetical protein
MAVLGITTSPKVLLAWPILLGAGIAFSAIALIFNALAKGYDFFTYYFTLFLTPMMFLSGVFFPREQLPAPDPGGERLAAAHQRGGAGAPAVPRPMAGASLAQRAGAGGVCRGRVLGRAGAHAAPLLGLTPPWPRAQPFRRTCWR